ncbi:MAG: hypothetical protein B6D55_00020 [Candidatus Omnitrophica bacterium 4484_70.2]|nr:MAG: hypothetical protein B6D55_00020 [Candidatus Omnitrophica bacterium 4484_70.2]
MRKKCVIGIGLNLFDAQASLLRDDGKIIVHIEKKRKFITANETIDICISLFEEILKKSKKYRDSILGAGLALGGIVNRKKGEVYWPQRQDNGYIYISVPLKKYLEEKFSLPTYIENDANACAWAEYRKNYNGYKNIIYMFSGVGCGIILGGDLYIGGEGGAGELFINPQPVMSSYLGNFRFLTQWPHDLGVIKRAKELISLGRETRLVKRIDSAGNLSLEDVFLEAKNKDKVACEVLEEAAFSLGIKISFLVNFINPQIIIIGGGFEEAGDFFLKKVIQTIKKYAFSFLQKNLKVEFSSLGRKATSLGVAQLIIDKGCLH